MRPLVHDFKKTLGSKPLLAAIILMLLYSFAVAPPMIPRGGPAYDVYYTGGYYYDQGAFHVLICTYNGYGQPLPGVMFTFSFVGSSSNLTQSIVTGSNSCAQLTLPYASAVAGETIQFNGTQTMRSARTGYEGGFHWTMTVLGEGRVSQLNGPFLVVADPSDVHKSNRLLFDSGTYFSPPDDVLYYVTTGAGQSPDLIPGEMHSITQVTNYTTLVDLSEAGSVGPQEMMTLGLFDRNGTLLAKSVLRTADFASPYVGFTPTDSLSALISQFETLVLPLLAVLGAISCYGMEKVTGVLDSVLARPVSRRGLLLTRYAAAVIGVSLAAIVSTLAMDLMIWYYTGEFVQTGYILAFAGAFVVVSAAFVGIMFIVSHLAKSIGTLIGAALGIYLVLAMFWNVLVPGLISTAGGSLQSSLGRTVLTASYFLNPAQFPNLIQAALGGAFIFGVPIELAPSLSTVFFLVLDAAIWISGPLAIALVLAQKRD